MTEQPTNHDDEDLETALENHDETGAGGTEEEIAKLLGEDEDL